jgi:hypothetical protein
MKVGGTQNLEMIRASWELSELFFTGASTNLLHLRNLFKRVLNDLAQYRDYERYRVSQYIFLWCGLEHINSRWFSVWEQCKMGKRVIYLWRQCLVFIHNNTEMKGMWGMFSSHWQGLWVTCEPSRVFLKLWVTPMSHSYSLESISGWSKALVSA